MFRRSEGVHNNHRILTLTWACVTSYKLNFSGQQTQSTYYIFTFQFGTFHLNKHIFSRFILLVSFSFLAPGLIYPGAGFWHLKIWNLKFFISYIVQNTNAEHSNARIQTQMWIIIIILCICNLKWKTWNRQIELIHIIVVIIWRLYYLYTNCFSLQKRFVIEYCPHISNNNWNAISA